MNHNSHLLGYTTRLQWRGKRQEHSVDLNFTQENLRNLRNTYRGLLNQSGASYYEYYDAVKTGNRLWQDFHVGYTARWGIVNELPLWSVQAGLDVNRRKQTGYDYPYERKAICKLSAICSFAAVCFPCTAAWRMLKAVAQLMRMVLSSSPPTSKRDFPRWRPFSIENISI